MSTPLFLRTPQIERLPSLLDEVRHGRVRVPRFQRPFIWTDSQRLDLLDSIWKGMPIGSLLFWRTETQDLAVFGDLGGIQLDFPDPDSSSVRQYLLDGHQRVTTLFAALEPWRHSLPGPPPEDAPIATYFDLTDGVFVLEGPEPPPPHWLPTDVLFHPFELFRFLGKLRERPDSEDLMRLAEQVSSHFKDYAVPIIPIVADVEDELDRVTESFERVNSRGTTMSLVHMVSALHYSRGDADLNQQIETLLENLDPDGWSSLDSKLVLATVKAQLGLEVYEADARALADALRANPGAVGKAGDALSRAARFLCERCDIHGAATLPYSYQIVLLADALGRVPASHAEALEGRLTNWFWRHMYLETFGSNAPAIRAELEQLGGWAEPGASTTDSGATDATQLEPETVNALTRFHFTAARSKASALALARFHPRDIAGVPMDGLALLGHHGARAIPQLVDRRRLRDTALVSSVGNRHIARPEEVRRLGRLLRSRDVAGDIEMCESHAIDDAGRAALEEQDMDALVSARARCLLQAERDHARRFGIEIR